MHRRHRMTGRLGGAPTCHTRSGRSANIWSGSYDEGTLSRLPTLAHRHRHMARWRSLCGLIPFDSCSIRPSMHKKRRTTTVLLIRTVNAKWGKKRVSGAIRPGGAFYLCRPHRTTGSFRRQSEQSCACGCTMPSLQRPACHIRVCHVHIHT